MANHMEINFFDASLQAPVKREVPVLQDSRGEDPAGYIASSQLTNAINTSILLGQPLLLTGDPGVGKTSVGRAVADRLGLPLLEFTVKSTSRAVDLFYEYDAVGRFQAAEADRASAARLSTLSQLENSELAPEVHAQIMAQANRDPRLDLLQYLHVRALGRAILNASSAAHVSLLLEHENDHAPLGGAFVRDPATNLGRWQETQWPKEPIQSVVIIDEIDKAPSDFCNDLLDELDTMRFQVPELATYGETSDAPRFGGNLPPGRRPIIFITSNQQRQLPEAFLRRCCYHHIEMPSGAGLDAIIERRLGSYAGMDADAHTTAMQIYHSICGLLLSRKPGLAELMNWLRYLSYHRSEEQMDFNNAEHLKLSLTALIKDLEDRKTVEAWIDRPRQS